MSKLYISMYHYTRDLKYSRYPRIRGLDIKLFRRQLDFFKQKFNVVNMEDVINAAYGGRDLPENALLLTFDDGYIDNFTVAFPILMEMGIQGSFFVPGKIMTENVLLDVNKIHFILANSRTEDLVKDLEKMIKEASANDQALPDYETLYETYAMAGRYDDKNTVFCKRVLQTGLPEKLRNKMASRLFEKYVAVPEAVIARELYMNQDQIRLMRYSGMFFGVHGYDHYWLTSLPSEQMQKDIDLGLDVMAQFIDRNAWVMNYPYGDYDETVISCVKNRNCVLGLTTEVRAADLSADDRYRLPRLDCNDFPPKSDNYRSL